MKNEVKAKAGGEENVLKKEAKAERMHVWERKRTCTYSQMNERVTGEVMKNHVKKQKIKGDQRA